jgi:Tol biopolymer transport system component/DNA-binding winged helix-turn-helix (wHTH) protein
MSRQARPSYQFGPFLLDPSEQVLLCDGRPLPLTPKAFEVLRVLVENSGHLVDKDQLLKEIWPDCFVEEGGVNRYVSVVRKTLSERDPSQQYILTVPKRGYRFVVPVSENASVPVQPDARTGSGVAVRPVAGWSWPRRLIGLAGALLSLSYAVLAPSGLPSQATLARASRSPAHRQITFTGSEGAPTISPDGQRVAYLSSGASEKSVVVETLPGGNPVVVFVAPEVSYLRWSPDGANLLLWARGSGYDGVYLVSHAGGTPTTIAPKRFVACWSPDGSAIAVVSYVGKMWFVDTNGRLLRTVTLESGPESVWDIDWSPATGRLVFTSGDAPDRYAIWTIQPDGSEQTKVLDEQPEVPSVRWAPQGDAIYYLGRMNQTDSLQRLAIRSGRADGPIATLMTGLETDRSFAVSADGTRLVYARAPYYSNLWRLDVHPHGTPRVPSTTELTRGTSLVERPRVSPDGTTVVFTLGHEPRTELYTVPIAGGRPTQLTFLDSFSVAGGWSPDGRQIAFASTLGGKRRVWTIEAAGGQARAVSSSDLSDSFDLVWSPGSRILFQRPGNRNFDELDLETRGTRPLLGNGAPGWVFFPAYSPDGRKVAVMWNRPPDRGIWVIDTIGRRATLLRRTAKSAEPVGWSADGRTVYVVEGENGPRRGWTAPIGETKTHTRILALSLDGRVKTIAQLAGEIGGVGMSPDASRFVYVAYSSRSDVWVVDDFDATSGRAVLLAGR